MRLSIKSCKVLFDKIRVAICCSESEEVCGIGKINY